MSDSLKLELQGINYELLYRCWESNPCPLEEQSVLLSADPSLHPPVMQFLRTTYIIRLCFQLPALNNNTETY